MDPNLGGEAKGEAQSPTKQRKGRVATRELKQDGPVRRKVKTRQYIEAIRTNGTREVKQNS